MPSSSPTPKETGGGGFEFEDEVVAYVLACVLTDNPVLDAEYGSCERIEFQMSADGWHLDDLVLHLRHDLDLHRLALSIKSNRQIKQTGLPEREAMNHLGHKSKAIHAAYGRRATITTLPLEYYEAQKTKKIIEFSEARKDSQSHPHERVVALR